MNAAPTRTTRRAFTVIELLVAVAVLALMVTMVTYILASSRALVNSAQAKMRDNAAAAALAEVLGADLRSASRNGFLTITQRPISGSDPNLIDVLAFTTARETPSLTSDRVGAAAVVIYGLTPNGTAPDDASNRILCRTQWVLTGDSTVPPATSEPTDLLSSDFAQIQGASQADLNELWVNVFLNTNFFPFRSADSGVLAIPPRDTEEVLDLWQAVGPYFTEFEVQWTDGATTGSGSAERLDWYDADNPHGGWEGRSSPDPEEVEFSVGGNYRALWSHHSVSWPKAIRVRFRLRNPELPEDQQSPAPLYEIICPVGE